MGALLEGVVRRRLEELVWRRMREEPVVLLQGPRTVGKSTLLRRLASRAHRAVIDLDDLATREAVLADPNLFVRSEAPVFIDEFQHALELLDAIKAELNVDARPGRFVITGSTRYASLPAAAQALTGRLHRIDVRPLSQGEIGGTREEFASRLLHDPRSLVTAVATPSPTTREQYARRIVAGGFPLVLQRTTRSSRTRWFDDYVDLVIERDLLELSRVRQRRHLPLLLRQLASQTAQVSNIAKAARTIGLDPSTAENYTKLLESVFLVERLPAWGTTLGSRVGASPKLHVVDAGLAARLLRLTEPKLVAATPSAVTEFGHLLETFVVGELHKQLDWLDEPVTRGHWRTHDEDEIDLVLERDDGRIVAIEVKAGSRVRGRDLGPMQRLRHRVGQSFVGGVVLYTGERAYTHDERLHVVPIDRLWAGAADPQ
jgi:predicted AAA+ superfamily ATPase